MLQSQEKVCVWQESLFLFNYSFFPNSIIHEVHLMFLQVCLFFYFGNSSNNNSDNNNNDDDDNF